MMEKRIVQSCRGQLGFAFKFASLNCSLRSISLIRHVTRASVKLGANLEQERRFFMLGFRFAALNSCLAWIQWQRCRK